MQREGFLSGECSWSSVFCVMPPSQSSLFLSTHQVEIVENIMKYNVCF